MQTLALEFVESVIKISLNRPREFNALNDLMLNELMKVIENVRNDRGVRAVVLTGNGRAFCYGLDAQEMSSLVDEADDSRIGALLKRYQSIILALATLDRPVVAAINGFATGAGLDLALACDIRMAAEKVKLSSAYIKMGLIPDGGGTFFLPRIVGHGRAVEMIMRGTVLTAEEALGIGLVSAVRPADRLVEEALTLAREIADGPTRAVALAKQAVFANSSTDLAQALENESRLQLQCFCSHDHAEAVTALREKRAPRFKGN
ncbi:MAG: enoyl-CoA hydratase-related protein [Acidobacteriota bacterium]